MPRSTSALATRARPEVSWRATPAALAPRYGTARAHVAGLEAVLADCSIVSRLAGLT
jgi:hypothetical protein